jgi:hypothetical protein
LQHSSPMASERAFVADLGPSARLVSAADAGDVAAVQRLLADSRSDPTAQNGPVLRSAIVRGLTGVVAAFLADGRADPCADRSFCLDLAVMTGHVDVVQALLADGRVNLAADGQAYGYCMRFVDGVPAKAAPVFLPVRQCLERWLRWQRRRAWLRACW